MLDVKNPKGFGPWGKSLTYVKEEETSVERKFCGAFDDQNYLRLAVAGLTVFSAVSVAVLNAVS
ncbi:MAG: hypothetical protein ACK5YU_01140, partial [Burkholderiales bacterium]